jgi:hypothetical protein
MNRLYKITVAILLIFSTSSAFAAKEVTVNLKEKASKFITAVQKQDVGAVLLMDYSFVAELLQMQETLPKFQIDRELKKKFKEYADKFETSGAARYITKSCKWKILEIKGSIVYVAVEYKDMSEAPDVNTNLVKSSVVYFNIYKNGLIMNALVSASGGGVNILSSENIYWYDKPFQIYHFTVYQPNLPPEHVYMRKDKVYELYGGTTIKLLETTEAIEQFVPKLSGPAARVEVTPLGEQPKTSVVVKNDDERDYNNIVIVYNGI